MPVTDWHNLIKNSKKLITIKTLQKDQLFIGIVNKMFEFSNKY